MPRVHETTVYQLDELDDSARDRARDWYRQSSTSDFADHGADSVLDDANRIARLLGIRVSTRMVKLMGGGTRHDPEFAWEVGSYRGTDGASFAGYYSHFPGSTAAIRQECPRDTALQGIARDLAAVQRKYGYRLSARISRSAYYRGADSHGMSCEVAYDGDRTVADSDAESLTQAIKDFADWIGGQLTREYEYQQSDEAVDESIRANEYEFTADGRRCG